MKNIVIIKNRVLTENLVFTIIAGVTARWLNWLERPVHTREVESSSLSLATLKESGLSGSFLYFYIFKGDIMRIGQGYDVHRLTADRKLILGGVEIPYEKGLLGHSDADVLLHAIADALLGAAALGDIGKHFPDTDERYKGISSLILLEKTGELLTENRFIINNIDSTVIAERPKLRPYIDEMRENIAKALHLSIDAVSVKATTEEGLGFTGTGEGIAAQAVCLLSEPADLIESAQLVYGEAGCGGCPGGGCPAAYQQNSKA